MSLNKFTHILLLKNDAQLKQKKKVTNNLKKEQIYYIKKKKKEKEKEGNLKKPTCTCIWAFLSIKKKFFPIQFSLYFGEKTFW